MRTETAPLGVFRDLCLLETPLGLGPYLKRLKEARGRA